MAVLPRADVALRVQRQRAQRARRPAGGDDPLGAHDEGAGDLGADADAQRVRALVVLGQRLDLGLVLGLGASASTTTWPVSPSQARPIAPTRNSSSTGASSGAVSSSSVRRGRRDLAGAAAPDLLEQLLEPLGEHLDLHLLQRDRDGAAAAGGLQVEGALARLADRAGDEALRRVEEEDLSGARARP